MNKKISQLFTGKTKPPILPKPILSSSTVSGEHVIPQMVITSADDVSTEIENSAETTPVPVPSNSEGTSTSLQDETKNPDIAVDVVHQRPLVISDGTGEEIRSDKESNVESISHSVIQRPLIFEPEKPNIQSDDTAVLSGEQFLAESSPSPIPSLPPTTMQRPLIFDGSAGQPEVTANVENEEHVQHNVVHSKTKEDSRDDILAEDKQAFYEEPCELPVLTDSKPKSMSFSWMPNFSKPHAAEKLKKSNVDSHEIAVQSDNVADTQMMQDTEKAHIKKDSLHGVKKFFDSFRHETPLDAKEKSGLQDDYRNESNVINEMHKVLSPVTPEAKLEEGSASSEPPESQKKINSVAKDHSKHIKRDIKHFFDSFKQDSADKKDKSFTCGSVDHEPQLESSEDLKVAPKDSKHGMKKLSSGQDPVGKESSERRVEIGKSNRLDMKAEEDKGFVNKFLDSFKHEKSQHVKESSPSTALPLSSESSKEHKDGLKMPSGSFSQETPNKQSDSPSPCEVPSEKVVCSQSVTPMQKDNLSGVKKFFGSFKHDMPDVQKEKLNKPHDVSSSVEVSKPCDISNSSEVHSESLHGVNKFFDSFKRKVPQMQENTGAQAEHKEKSIKHSVSFKEPTDVETKKPETEKRQKESVHGVRKFFDSLKQEGNEIQLEIKGEEKQKDKGVKRSHSFKESMLERNISGTSDRGHKDSLHGVKKFFDSFKRADAEISNEEQMVKRQKVKEVKRSQSFKETAEEKASYNIKGFFDSLTHKDAPKVSSQSPASLKELACKKSDHIYDVVESPTARSACVPTASGSKRITSLKASDVQGPSSNHEFDSFIHKDSTSKPPQIERNEDAYDNIDFPSQKFIAHGTVISSDEKEHGAKVQKDSLHGIKKYMDSFRHKDSSKVIFTELKETAKYDKKSHVKNTSSSVDVKTSLFTSIGDNILAMKDKMMQSKEVKKSEVIASNNSVCQEYDLQNAAKSKEFPEQNVGTYKPLEEVSLIKKDFCEDMQGNQPKQTVMNEKHVLKNSPNSPELTSLKTKGEPGTPETLYDTCCMRIAVLLRNKALEIVSDQTKTPPKKPPKPSAEAIAKARAAAVSRRLQALQNKGQSIGDNIPVGFDGIRYADDETESSCDYKDIENFDYIIDYGLINRYKFDNKLDTFSDPSTCSGMTSYYTADTVTLKDENFSDAALETISLGSDDSNHFKYFSPVQMTDESSSMPTLVNTKVKDKKGKFSTKSPVSEPEIDHLGRNRGVSDTAIRLSSSGKVCSKKIPPPIPPKPILSPKAKTSKSKFPLSPPDETCSISQCINGLSLSPRVKTKFSKDAAGTKQRPLMVADVKETSFMSLRQTKSKGEQKKQTKERRFDTVLKNEALKNINSISAFHPTLTSTKSLPPEISISPVVFDSSLTKKASPQRPPPPVNFIRYNQSKISTVSPPEKPKRESAATPESSLKQKRTLSPPRPPPPSVAYKPSVPPVRPPPPPKSVLNIEVSHEAESQNLGKPPEEDTMLKSTDLCAEPSKFEQSRTLIPALDSGKDTSSISLASVENVFIQSSQESGKTLLSSEVQIQVDDSVVTQPQIDLNSQDILCVETDEMQKITGNLKDASSYEPVVVISELTSKICERETVPKPPPRVRRIRSRTVEIAPVEKVPESRLRRSQSLTEIDVQKRMSYLNTDVTSEKCELKSLYTTVNKDGKRTVLSSSRSSSLEKVSSRPLPAPPAPPRRFRSLDRKPKDKEKKVGSKLLKGDENIESPEVTAAYLSVKPPLRKRKIDKPRFHSLGNEDKKEVVKLHATDASSSIPRSASVPLKPERRLKHAAEEKYDENANVAIPVVAEVHCNPPQLDECGNEILEHCITREITDADHVDAANFMEVIEEKVSPKPRLKKNKNPRKKSHSSWYDESEPVENSWEIVNWNPADVYMSKVDDQPRVSMRRRSDPGKKTRQTSKFYVDIEREPALPLVDKETSPLPLDSSEKSVQTSLETLSQGIASRDEQSEDTDELLDLAQTLQNELKLIINRHKSTSENISEDSTPPISATGSERNLNENFEKKLKIPSIHSSTSELWPMTSSEESDGEHEASANLTEIAVTRKHKKIFYIAQEIMTSEEAFVDALKLLNVDFKAAVDNASKQKNVIIIPDDVLCQILNHLPQLQHLNENLLMELKDRIENWDKSAKIADIIVKMGPFLKLYSWYIHDFESNLALLEESKKKYPLFYHVVKEFEMSAKCKRLSLNHYMLKPIQRIPQYRLLLQEYLHNLPEDSPDYQDTIAALQIVSEVANHANDSMKQGDNAQKLISIQNSIMGHKEIIKPGRLFVKEGELMKLSRKGMQPRWFVLFNDLLLYLTPVQQGLYRINHELPLTGMKVAIPIQQDYQNEFSIISVTRSFTLAARSPEERQEWIIALTKAIEENASKRSTFTNIRLQQKVQGKASEDDEGEFVLGRKAPVWIPDARVTMCQLCTSEFTVTFRRHHCRACGKVVCSICSSNRISLPYLGNRIARVCDECHTKLGPGSSGCTESGETDSDNQQIAVKSHLRTEIRHVKKGKRNLPSVLKEVCANDQGSTISGYLQKRTGKSWKRDWFVIKDKVLYEYKASEDVAALRSTPLLGYQIEPFSEAFENIEALLLFQLTHPGQAPIIFHADTIGSAERWIAALKVASVLE